MKSIATLALVSGLLANVAIAQSSEQLSPQPTKLEAFATQPSARIIYAKEMGQINSSEARVVVSALIVEDDAEPPGRMRGVRIFLAKEGVTDEVYIEEAKLEAVRKALAEISRGVEEFHNEQSDTPLRYYGRPRSGRCRERSTP